MYHFILVKESRAGEGRTALIPEDIAVLVKHGHTVSVESNSGLAAGFNDSAYQEVGANIINIDESDEYSFHDCFEKADFIIRAKRPNRHREIIESKAFKAGTIMIGALDPLEIDSSHVKEYHHAGIKAYSIDQAALPATDPMNVLAAMSQLTGKLALRDALSKSVNSIEKLVIIGLGQVGQSALDEAMHLQLPVLVIVGNEVKAKALKDNGINACVVDRTLSIEKQQQAIEHIISDADIVITTARNAGQKAPLLIPQSTLDNMKPNAVIVDMTISEGGNVEGSKHDETIVTDRQVLITNVSGYPKAMPHEASILWSNATLNFILRYIDNPESIPLQPL